jgi:hypothetical protein
LNQQVAPSPRSFVDTSQQLSGQELPIKQNGAIPYHLHIGWMSAIDDKTHERRTMK